jgi:hypothetical protein
VTSEGTQYHPWTTYMWAREEARRRGDRRVGTDHLLLGLLHDAAIVSIVGVSLEQARRALDVLDRVALECLGLTASLDAPPLAMRRVSGRPTLRAVLQDRLPMTPAAKKALQDASRPMRKRERITPMNVLVCLLGLEHPDPAADLIVELNVDVDAVRARMSGA